MSIIPALVVAMGLAGGAGQAPHRQAIRYQSLKHGKAHYHVVVADLTGDRVSVRTVMSNRLTSVWSLIKRSRADAAITGTFFAFENQKPVAEVLVDGKLRSEGARGSVVAVDWFGRAKVFDAGYQESVDWGIYRYALRGGVRVVRDGRVAPNPRAQRFRDPRIWGRAARSAVGTTDDGRLALVATSSPVTLSQLGKAMCRVGVRNGVSLDGGGSTMLYYRGSMVVPPKRKLSNLLTLHEESPIESLMSSSGSASRTY